MALQDITNKPPKFRLHVDLENEYATLRSRRTVPNVSFDQLRIQGTKALDLWTDGAIYPPDPAFGIPPPFRNVTMLMRFIGDGFHGLLGYCRRLHIAFMEEVAMRRASQEAFKQLQELASKEKMSSEQKIKELLQELKEQKIKFEDRVKTVNRVAENYYQLRCSTRNLRRRVDHFTHLPFGYRERKRKRKAMDLLSQKGGQHKRRLRASRECAEALLGCDGEGNSVQASILKHIVREKDIMDMISNPSNGKLRGILQQHLLKNFQSIVTPKDMLDVCDAGGISHKGYTALYRCVTSRFRTSGMQGSLLPTPYSILMARQSANRDIGAIFGGYKSVEGTMQIPGAKPYEYNRFNNVYIDVQALQRAMINFYDLSIQDTGGKVIFVLKLDECQVVKDQKVERASLTLMSKALNGISLDFEEEVADGEHRGTNRKQDYYGVQSEKNIWWLASWTLPHEDHDALRWYFTHSGICNIVQRQGSGEQLEVPGMGVFDVEWHLGGDLKTLKCMLGCKLGANTLFPCIYCCHAKIPVDANVRGKKACKPKARTKKALEHIKGSNEWFNGIFSCDQSRPPCRDKEDNNWDPILSIPLSRVHLCTLHARLRIVDKLLRLHVNYAWNMEPAERREECLRALEGILSNANLHSGAVTLARDRKTPNSTQNNPNKISMGGAKARHLLSNHTQSSSHTEFEIWKKICDVTTYKGNDAALGLKRARVWESCDVMIKFLERPHLAPDEMEAFKLAIKRFTERMVDAWGETHVTHYMHILYAHAPYFLQEYGSLALWSNQGMEKSHYQAKGAYFKSTQHGGGRTRSNALHEMFNWFYRALTSSKQRKAGGNLSLRRKIMKVVSERRRQGYIASIAQERAQQWRATRRRFGSVWVSAV